MQIKPSLVGIIKQFSGVDVFAYFSYGLLAQIIPIVASFIIAHLMDAGDYGFVGVFIAMTVIFASLSNLGASQIIVREKQFLEPPKFDELVVSTRIFCLLLSLCIGLIYGVLFFVFEVDGIAPQWVVLAIVVGFCKANIDFWNKLFVVGEKPKAFGVSENAGVNLISILSILFVYVFSEKQLEARIIGYSLAILVWLSILAWIMKKYYVQMRTSIEHLKSLFFYGVKVLPQAVSNLVKMGADKILLFGVLPSKELGAYAFLLTVVSTIMVLGNALNNSFLSFSMKKYKEGDIKSLAKLRLKFIFTFLFSCLTACIALFYFAEYVFWPEGYEYSLLQMVVLFASFFFQVLYLLYVKYFIFAKNITLLGVVNLAFAILYSVLILAPSGAVTLDYVYTALLSYNFLLAAFVVLFVSRKEASILGGEARYE